MESVCAVRWEAAKDPPRADGEPGRAWLRPNLTAGRWQCLQGALLEVYVLYKPIRVIIRVIIMASPNNAIIRARLIVVA